METKIIQLPVYDWFSPETEAMVEKANRELAEFESIRAEAQDAAEQLRNGAVGLDPGQITEREQLTKYGPSRADRLEIAWLENMPAIKKAVGEDSKAAAVTMRAERDAYRSELTDHLVEEHGFRRSALPRIFRDDMPSELRRLNGRLTGLAGQMYVYNSPRYARRLKALRSAYTPAPAPVIDEE